MEAILDFIRLAGAVAVGFLGSNVVLATYVAVRVKRGRKAGLKRLAEAEEQMRAYFGEDFAGTGEGNTSDAEDAE